MGAASTYRCRRCPDERLRRRVTGGNVPQRGESDERLSGEQQRRTNRACCRPEIDGHDRRRQRDGRRGGGARVVELASSVQAGLDWGVVAYYAANGLGSQNKVLDGLKQLWSGLDYFVSLFFRTRKSFNSL